MRQHEVACSTMRRCFRADGRLKLALVGRGAIKRRHRNVVQPEIDGELRAVMDQMVHHEAPQHRDARHGEHLLASGKQRPRAEELLVGGLGEGDRAIGGVLVNASSRALRVVGGEAWGAGAPFGATSSESWLMVMTGQLGIFATCPASHPIVPDFSWGFQPSFSSGTRSSVLRVLAISRSNSGSNASLSAMGSSVEFGCSRPKGW